MAKTKVTINHAAARALLQSAEVQAELRRRADAIAAAAGDGNEVETNLTGTRARAVVITRTPESMRAEATNRTLTRALDAGRG